MKKSNFIIPIFLIINCQLSIVDCFSQFTKTFDFGGVASGRNPNGSLISDGTFLYGMTYGGGINDNGTVFKIKTDGTEYTKLLDFAGVKGSHPNGSLISDGTFLYGMTTNGGTGTCNGTSGCGVIFKIKPDGTGYTKLLDFVGTNGSNPHGSLISDGTFLYGMTNAGGIGSCTTPYSTGCGVIFKIKLDGTEYVKLMDFIGTTNGGRPFGSLFSDGTFLYGMTAIGGTNYGTIFKIKPDGTTYSKLFDFTDAMGSNPRGSLISDGTFLYGMTMNGGESGVGAIFKIKPDGTGFSKLFDFSGATDGASGVGSLVFDGIFLYAATWKGGFGNCPNGCGLIFKIKTDGTEDSKLLDFDGTTNGGFPYGTLYSSGTFLYGMTNSGGIYNHGTIFKYDIVTGITENKNKIDFTIYPNPSDGVFTISSKENEYKLIITNVLGENVCQSAIKNNKSEIDLSKQSNGIYFINLEAEKGTAVQQLIIQ